MKRIRVFCRVERAAAALFSLLLLCLHAQAQTDPLPSWADRPAKQAILDLVKATTDRANPNFVPPEARIATFDQDGTTWVEHPIYTQIVYCPDRLLSGTGSGAGESKAGVKKCRAIQDGSLRQP